MRRFTLALASAALLVSSTSAFAKSRGFDSTITAPVETAMKIEVVLSEDLAHRANNLPKKLSDRGNARSLRSGFAGNGFYGEKSLNSLVERIHEELNEDLTDRGVTISEDAPTILRVTLEDVKNNRPTFEQLSREPSLSFDSFGIGGAELSGELLGQDGAELGTVSYRWFDTGFDQFQFQQANGVWTDARRAISRFSKKTAKALT